jgi:hypothetical protein
MAVGMRHWADLTAMTRASPRRVVCDRIQCSPQFCEITKNAQDSEQDE